MSGHDIMAVHGDRLAVKVYSTNAPAEAVTLQNNIQILSLSITARDETYRPEPPKNVPRFVGFVDQALAGA